MRIFPVIIGMLLAAPAFGQSAGTVSLIGPSTTPGAPQVTRVSQINEAVNNALAAKQDYNAPGLFTTLIASGAVSGAGITALLAPYAPLASPAFTGGAALSYTAPGAPAQYGEINSNGTMNWPISGAGGCCRLHYWSDTITVTGNQAGVNVVEANFYNLILAGSGTLTNEAFNIVHPYVYIPSGVTISGYGENFEASALNDGTVSSLFGNLAIYANGAGTTGTYVGFRTYAVNNNAAVGSFATYEGLECGGVSGTGSRPTYNWCLVNRDSTATITTVGGVLIGKLGNQAAGTLEIDGPDTAGGTYPLFIKNSAATNLFSVSDSGSVSVYSGNLTVASGALSATGVDTSGGTYSLFIKNSASTNLFGIDNAGGAHLYVGDLTVTAGVVNATAFKVSGTIGVTCAGAPTGAFAVTFGIVTHC